MSARSLHRSMTRAVADMNETATHCGVTIAARLPVFMGCFMMPTATAMTEWNLAVSEKVEASWEGAVAATAELQAALIRSAFTPPTPSAFANDMMRVFHKAAHPARQRVRANARRLTRPAPAEPSRR